MIVDSNLIFMALSEARKKMASGKKTEPVADEIAEPRKKASKKTQPNLENERLSSDRLRMIDPEDREILKGKSDSYIVGWNKVKYKQSFQTG